MRKTGLFQIVAVAVVSAIAVGCATTGYQQAERTRKHMASTQDQILIGQQQVADTMRTLDGLTKGTDTDLVTGYKMFTQQLSKLRSVAKRAGQRAIATEQASANYLNNWAETIDTIQNPEIRKQSIARRKQAIADHREVAKSMKAASTAYQPLIADLEDIKTYLKEDLTANGLKAIRSTVDKANRDAKILNQKLSAALSEIGRVSENLSAQAGN